MDKPRKAKHIMLNQALPSTVILPVIADRVAYLCAKELLRIEGDDAILTASARAEEALSRENADQLGYWRRVEAAIQLLLLEDVLGTVH